MTESSSFKSGSRRKRVSEAEFLNALLVGLSGFNGAMVWRQQSGEVIARRRGRDYRVRLGPDGMADIGGVTREGRFFQIEAKAESGRQRPSQAAWQKAMTQQNVPYLLAIHDGSISMDENVERIREELCSKCMLTIITA